MKNLLIILLAITASIVCTTRVSAQYAIPAYNKSIVADPTNFEEAVADLDKPASTKPIFVQANPPFGDEERKMHVNVISTTPNQPASATFYIYSMDEEDLLGPFTVISEDTFEQAIDEREWGLEVISATANARMSVWIE